MIIIKYEVVKWIATFSNASYELRFIEEAWNKTEKAHGYNACMLCWTQKGKYRHSHWESWTAGHGHLTKSCTVEAYTQPTYLFNPRNRGIKIQKQSNYILQVI